MMKLDFDNEDVESALIRLFEVASDYIMKWNPDHVQTLIRVGEYGLALDNLAYAYLHSGKPIPEDILELFESLATEMVPGDDYNSVAELRARSRSG